MPVTRLRTQQEVGRQAGLEAAVQLLHGVEGAEELVALAERKLAAARGWKFIMVEPRLNAEVVRHLTRHSRRPLKAVELWAELFAFLPPDSNEVMADRDELARTVGIQPQDVSEIMGELEAVGAVYRRREGRGVRYFVHPRLGTHLAGAIRDRAQAQAPPLRLRLVEPAE
jgi:DNA-binding transcriptional ArsR family regulator